MLSLQASLSITFYLSLLLNFVNLNSANIDSKSGYCTPYPCNQPPQPPSSTGYNSPYGNQPPQPPSSTGYSPYGNPPPPSSSPPSPPSPPSSSSSRSHCPPVPTTGCCNQPPPSTTMYSPPYPYFYTPPYPFGTLGGGGQGGGGTGGVATGAAVSYYSSSVSVYVLMFVLFSYAFFVL